MGKIQKNRQPVKIIGFISCGGLFAHNCVGIRIESFKVKVINKTSNQRVFQDQLVLNFIEKVRKQRDDWKGASDTQISQLTSKLNPISNNEI